ncbi:MAG: type VI secretion system membrane subunit TssM [Pyrinomonadaceae bacterium]
MAMNRQFYMQQMRYVLGIGGFMSFYGIAGGIVFLSGKYLGVSVRTQIVVGAMLLLTLPFALAGGYFVSRKSKKKEKAEEKEKASASGGSADSSSSAGEAKPATPSGNYADIPSGAAEVGSFLKESNLGVSGAEAVYGLPWYLVAGAKGSGKSSLVVAADLDLQRLPSQRQSELTVIKPTKQVDWRVASEAVFVDASGRLQNEGGSDEWATLVEAIKKLRPKRPLDGLVLTVNTEQILAGDEKDIEEQAKSLRAALDDAAKRLNNRFPVYLVFTHADAIEGFRDSFSRSKKDGDNLVWGTTFPLEKCDNSQSLFDAEYEKLQESVMKRRLIRLSAPFSPVRQLRILNFPLHFGSARRKLGSFVSTLFRPNPFSESPFLRGFYFTASPAARERGRGKPGALPKTVGDSYFVKKLFREVILRDKDLVKTFQEQRQKPPIMGWLMTALGVFLVTAFLGLCALSMYNNKRLLDDVQKAGEDVLAMQRADDGKDIFKKSPEEAQQEIDKLEKLRLELVRLDDYERNGPPLTFRFGFYSGSRIYRERLLNIYYNSIERRYRKPLLAKLQADLQSFAGSSSIVAGTLSQDQEKTLEKNYDYLKAYLMLTNENKENADPAALSETLEPIWISESKLPAGNEEKSKAQLDFYFKQVDREAEYDDDLSKFPRFTENKTLVGAVRTRLEAYPAYLRYLKLSVSEVAKEMDPVSADTLLQGRSQGVISGSHPIPAAYTIEGYRTYMKKAFADATGQMNKDDWVMGKKTEASASADDLAKLQDKYFNDYTDHWRRLIRDVKVIEPKNTDSLSKLLGAFSDTDSPMKLLLKEVAANTDFSSKPAAKGWTDLSWISDWWNGKNTGNEVQTKNIVEREFRPLIVFIGADKDDNSAPVSKYGAMMKDLNDEIGNISPSEKAAITDELIKEKGKRFSLIKKVENGVTDLTRGFDSQAGKEIANLLRSPLISVRGFFGEDAKAQIEADWKQRLLPMARGIERGYPFSGDGEADMANLAKFLNPKDGDFTKFYKERLERYFEEVDGKLRVKETSEFKFAPEFIEYVNNAFALRKAMFGESPTPSFEYDFRLLPVKDALIEVTIDGQTVTSDQTGSVKLKFPAATGAATGVLMRFSSTAPGAALPPAQNPAPANPGDPNVTTSNPAPSSNYMQDSGTSEIKYQGNWGLFRFFDGGSPKKQATGEYLLTYTLGGKTVQATARPTGGDLFDKSLFRNLKAPDNMLQ